MRYFILAVGVIIGFPVIPAMAQNHTDNPPVRGQYISPCHDGNTCNTMNVGTLGGTPGLNPVPGGYPGVPSTVAPQPPPSQH
ncbi:MULTISPECIES: hypothetical protein [unclassified Mesorhizobium]|uniref:hypothetical protein n=1 Tax=unclassified Mesorhizobium TaxID=325217 RepID=UPI000FC9B60B|nr:MULTISPECIES: hypothetical protein [unclassified Mesorhizobium]RUW77262.1 hypothetical protein EOA31_04930 [Mesorhizobium sp. M4B.F.Ca.ET.049.02.1.2]TGV23195.1 hypothetical protein EN786_25210 [Mesorhizobium sp. M4B.F.Ca.ET.143.01.1.1]